MLPTAALQVEAQICVCSYCCVLVAGSGSASGFENTDGFVNEDGDGVANVIEDVDVMVGAEA